MKSEVLGTWRSGKYGECFELMKRDSGNKAYIAHNEIILKLKKREVNENEALKEFNTCGGTKECVLFNISVILYKNSQFSEVFKILNPLWPSILMIEFELSLKIVVLLVDIMIKLEMVEHDVLLSWVEKNLLIYRDHGTDPFLMNLSLYQRLESKSKSLKDLIRNDAKSSDIIVKSRFESLTDALTTLVVNRNKISENVFSINLAAVYMRMKKYNLALLVLNSIPKGVKNAKVAYNAGLCLFQLRRFEEALKEFQYASKCIDLPQMWLRMADCQLEMNNSNQRTELIVDPKYVILPVEKFDQLNDFLGRAKSYLLKGLKIAQPSHIRNAILERLAYVCILIKEPHGVIEYHSSYSKDFATTEQVSNLDLYAIEAYCILDQLEKAINLIKLRLGKFKSGNSQYWIDLVYIRVFQGDHVSALEILNDRLKDCDLTTKMYLETYILLIQNRPRDVLTLIRKPFARD